MKGFHTVLLIREYQTELVFQASTLISHHGDSNIIILGNTESLCNILLGLSFPIYLQS